MEAPCVISHLYLFSVSCYGMNATITHKGMEMIRAHLWHSDREGEVEDEDEGKEIRFFMLSPLLDDSKVCHTL